MSGIVPTDHRVKVRGVGQSPVIINKMGITVLGKGYYHPKLPLNIVSQSQARKDGMRYRYDYKNDQFIMYIDEDKWIFSQRGKGDEKIYKLVEIDKPPVEALVTQEVATQSNRKRGHHVTPAKKYTLENREALDLRKLHEALGHPSNHTTDRMLENGIEGWPHSKDIVRKVTKGSINQESEDRFKCEFCQHGKGTLINTFTPHADNTLIGNTLDADIMFSTYNGRDPLMVVLISCERATKWLDIIEISQDTVGEHLSGHSILESKWKLRGKPITNIVYDGDKKLGKLDNVIFNILQTQPGTHNERIEREIRTCRERAATILHALHFVMIPKMYIYFIIWVIETINRQYRKDLGRSPYQALYGKNLVYDVDLTVAFGDLIICNVRRPPGSLNKLKAVRQLGIVIGAHMNGTGTITVLCILSGQIITTSGIARAIVQKEWTPNITLAIKAYLFGGRYGRGINPIAGNLFTTLPSNDNNQNLYADAAEYLQRHQTLSRYGKWIGEEKVTPTEGEAGERLLKIQQSMVSKPTIENMEPIIVREDANDLKSPTERDLHPSLNCRERAEGDVTYEGSGSLDKNILKEQLGRIPQLMEEDKQRDTDVDASNSHTTLHNHTEKGPLYAMDPSKGGCEEDPSQASRLHDAMASKKSSNEPGMKVTDKQQTSEERPLYAMDHPKGYYDENGQALTDWVQCNKCGKWRILSKNVDSRQLPEIWECKDNTWNIDLANCNAEEEDDPWAEYVSARYNVAQKEGQSTISTLEVFLSLATIEEDIQIQTPSPDMEKGSEKEVQNILDHDVLTPEYANNCSELELSKKVEMRVFAKLKRDKTTWKYRAPTGVGRYPQDKRDVNDTYAPTARHASIVSGVKIALIEKRKISTIDIASAYLNADLPISTTPEGHKFRRLLCVKDTLLETFLKLKPEWKEYVSEGEGYRNRHKGCLFLVISKALYGLLESGLLWYDKICQSLSNLSLIQSYSDPCVWHDHKGTSIILYVDDLLLLCKDDKSERQIIDGLTNDYKRITYKHGQNLDYLGTELERLDEGIFMHHEKYMIQMLKDLDYDVNVEQDVKETLPYRQNLFEIDPDSPELNTHDTKIFVSTVMKLLYPTVRTRPKLLLVVTFLTTRLTRPTIQDQTKLKFAIDWVNRNQKGGIFIGPESNVEDTKLYMWCDASDMTHWDARGHSGIVISIGKEYLCPIMILSHKIKSVARSSTESELVTVYAGLPKALWAMESLTEWGYPCECLELYQDNVSTIISAHVGHKPYSKLGHMNRRFFDIKEHLDNGTIIMPHCDTEYMISDCLTKATLPKDRAIKQYNQICGIEKMDSKESLSIEEKELIANMCYLTRLKSDEEIEAFLSSLEVNIEEEEHEEEDEEENEETQRIKRSNNTITSDNELDNLID